MTSNPESALPLQPFAAQRPGPPPTMVASTPEDLLAFIPVAFGFVPDNSVVLLALKGSGRTLTQPFQARLDLPDDPARDVALADCLIDPCLRHDIEQVLIVVYGPRTRAGVVAETLTHRLQQFGIEVVDIFGTHHRTCFPLGPGQEGVPARVFDLQSHPFSAEAVLHGMVTASSREELAATFVARPEAVAEVVQASRSAHPIATSWIAQSLACDAARESITPAQAAAWIMSLRHAPARQAILTALNRDNARDQLHLWGQILRSCPLDARSEVAAVVGLVAWLHGNGAMAWCALDACLSQQPDHLLGQCVAQALTEAWPPTSWEGAVHTFFSQDGAGEWPAPDPLDIA